MADRVVVFLDYQNVYMSAREAFHPSDGPHWDGQINPTALGELLVNRSPFNRYLSSVRVYRGIPDSTKDPKGYGACMRQNAAWSRSSKVKVLTRPLLYPSKWPGEKPREKGIDVSLSVDFVLMAAQRRYDIGILMSTDTDIKPALEAVVKLGVARTEVAAWRNPAHSHRRRLHIPGRKVWCHWLDADDYNCIKDNRDYAK